MFENAAITTIELIYISTNGNFQSVKCKMRIWFNVVTNIKLWIVKWMNEIIWFVFSLIFSAKKKNEIRKRNVNEILNDWSTKWGTKQNDIMHQFYFRAWTFKISNKVVNCEKEITCNSIRHGEALMEQWRCN